MCSKGTRNESEPPSWQGTRQALSHHGWCTQTCGTQLVTSSGDTTVRLWDLSRSGCTLTLRGHSRAVRGCTWHSCGDFVASASADCTSKIWDVNRYGGSALANRYLH
uniref:SPG16 protein n=1 Tax=Junco hyemalis TaxID=40217 RepID=A0A8C5II03_JUNHY